MSAALPTLHQVLERYGKEGACLERFAKIRWPHGPRCRKCTNRPVTAFAATVRDKIRHLYQCSRCGDQFSVTAGTLLHRSHLPLTQWFLGAYFMAVSSNRMQATELQQILGVSYETAWSM